MGYYCPNGAKQACPAGYYSGSRTGLRTMDECIICPAGFYCPLGEPDPIPAPVVILLSFTRNQGHYNPWMGMSSVEAMLKCPQSYPCTVTGLSMYKGPPCALGYYCPAGTSSPTQFACPAGTYSNSHYAVSEYDCLPCPRGYACDSKSTQETLQPCDPGHYCPRGTPTTTTYPCPAGTYRLETKARRLEDCLPCPHGNYCPAGTSVLPDCPEGYYCPLGTKYDKQYPCRAGTYGPVGVTNLKSQQDCLQCGFGKYCTGNGQTAGTDCPDGYYNNFSMEASECLKCPAGYKCVTGTINPVPCPVGEYSDTGAKECTKCEIGFYCPEPGISKADKLSSYKCYAGMYCNEGGYGLAVYPNLDDHGCNVGKYCPEGTTTEVPCPAGTYNPVYGRSSVTECLTTVPGYYTEEGASEYLSTPCLPGHFCLAGSPTSTQYACPPGTYRKLNAGAKPEECVTCPAGYYCLTATEDPLDCPQGFYCPLGTSKPEPCPEGTYSTSLNLFDSRSCSPCPAGKFCYQRNLTNPVNKCDPGFYCIQGSKRPEPQDRITGNLCPKGGYCPEGASEPQPCPAGKYMVIEGASAASQCVRCPPGHYCTGSNSPEPTGKCDPGYYCGFEESERAPVGKQAQPGYYAPTGSQFELKCPRGTFTTQAGRSVCDECDPGYKCTEVGMSIKDPCPVGYYCPSLSWFVTNGESYDKLPCPIGTFNAADRRASINDCTPCPAGEYCSLPGQDSSDGQCDAGFYCLTSSPYKRPPVDDASGRYGACPPGKFCPQGTSVPQNCPLGTYSSNPFLCHQPQIPLCQQLTLNV
eukprot:TRINITY_DN1484_c0_g1_i1.p1 TRINITY_DN1484_c0_g1~~TRINITY_DN1484_c0_g1_i1.p1  ORF type:complete len:805 (+),score=10.50 TRINITY_DN1484_c0_g1_i1:2730-5144(+)